VDAFAKLQMHGTSSRSDFKHLHAWLDLYAIEQRMRDGIPELRLEIESP